MPTRGKTRYQELIRRRVHRILLVSSLYDSFILSEDGQLSDTIQSEFSSLNLSTTPDLVHVSSGEAALERLRRAGHFDMIITSMRVRDMDAAELARVVREAGLDIPVVLLAYDNRELIDYRARRGSELLAGTFLWQGDVRILLAMVKQIEDRWNVDQDTMAGGVPVILVVEDNVRFYSSFLPVVYTEVVKHTQRLVAEELNLYQKKVRLRARPKILLCETYEQAKRYFDAYEEHVLGVISDIEFPRAGVLSGSAGVDLAREIRAMRDDVPIMLQSSIEQHRAAAAEVEAGFLLKGSPTLLIDLRKFMVENLGFGDFVFYDGTRREVGRAPDLKTLVQKLQTVPIESIAAHAARNHFSFWLKARGECGLAETLRERRVSDYASHEEMRADLIRTIGNYRRERDRVVVADFKHAYDSSSSLTRVGGGSLGGKARGLAFINRLLSESRVAERFPHVDITVPQAVVLATDVFDAFLDHNRLGDYAIHAVSDDALSERFVDAEFPEPILDDLRAILKAVRYPLAVRSSGLLEDSPFQPFAGVYETFMVPNNDADLEVRLAELVSAVKRVYASTFSQHAKGFLGMTPYRLEEEKMAVILQQIVGDRHQDRFYPDFAGVARSHNFYPVPPLDAGDGIVALALGLGRTVVDGERCLRFSPRHPQVVPDFSSAEDAVKSSQRTFWALDLSRASLARHPLAVAEEDGTLASVGSTYSPDNRALYDGISRPGARVVSFAQVLKHGAFPLAELLVDLLKISEDGTSSAVEIEFAGKLPGPGRERGEFGFLQMRPLALGGEAEEIAIGEVEAGRLVCRSSNVLGNGRIDDVYDLVVVDREGFDRGRSHEAAAEVARLNARLQSAGIPYVLIGVGRWGSADPHLGIPVSWNQIAGVRVVVEAQFRDMTVSPSQGTHFFQNLTSCNVGYFTVGDADDGFIDWAWLTAQPATEEAGAARHIRLERPLQVKMSGSTGQGVILKPEEP